jgi:hypothetical protein
MTDPTNPAAAAPGWYPDASGAQRWWDGRGWTEHVAAPAPATAQAYERPQLAEGTKVDTVWIWIVALGMLINLIPLFFFDFGAYMRSIVALETDPTAGVGSAMVNLLGFYALSWGLGLLTYGLTVFSAFRDYKHLVVVGAVRPFHWAFAFIPYPLVYLIGRHVVLRKMTRTSGAPLWTHVALLVLLFIGSLVWAMVIFAQIMNEITTMYPYGSYS